MSQPLHIAFIWHMHQPHYRDMVTGECRMPWVRLHASKDYLDMLLLLQEFPSLHQTFNVVPSLLDQLEDYAPPRSRSDRALDLSRIPVSELSDAHKQVLLSEFFMANWDRMIAPHPRYHDLLAKRGAIMTDADAAEAAKRFRPQDYLDLQVWFNLVWIDPWLRRRDPELTRLEGKGAGFTEEEKRLVLERQLALVRQVIPAYRDAQARGQIELTTTPYYHPITPLVCDLKIANQALPGMTLPQETFRHPEDARWHMREALRRHEEAFGRRPQGLWPAEGGVSEDLVALALEQGVRWIATDEEILWRTLKTGRSPSELYRPHAIRRGDRETAMLFRDHELSDLIGFTYSQWDAEPAVQDLTKRLGALHQQFQDAPSPALVSIILDGENAWECYPDDGYPFLHALYEALSRDDRFRLVTVREHLDRHPADSSRSLPSLFAGSWIDGNFATWIGHPEKNAAWSHLARARQDLIAARPSHAQEEGTADPAWKNFFAAEGSDWMWWFGDTHSSAQDTEFDRLFRAHLSNVYRELGQAVPAWLDTPIKAKPAPPLSEPTARITPVIDGRETTYYEWLYAGRIDLRKGYSAIHRSRQALTMLQYGLDQDQVYVRVDVDQAALAALAPWQIVLELAERRVHMSLDQAGPDVRAVLMVGEQAHPVQAAYQRIMELALPRALLGITPGGFLPMHIRLISGQDVVESYPAHGAFRVPIPQLDQQAQTWSV